MALKGMKIINEKLVDVRESEVIKGISIIKCNYTNGTNYTNNMNNISNVNNDNNNINGN